MQNITRSSQLNSMSIDKAREAIIQNLVTKWFSFDRELNDLSALLSEYESKLRMAREDGDTSENSAYEQAIDNLSSTQAKIHKTQKVKHEMSLITEPEFTRWTKKDDYEDIIEVLSKARSTSLMAELAYRHFGGDIEKIITATRKEMKDLMRGCDVLISNSGKGYDFTLDEQEIYEILREATYDLKARPYKPCGKVVMYSVVRVDINGSVHTFMICPNDISYMDEGIVAANSEIASRIMNNVVGEAHTIREGLSYEIKEIY